MPDICTASITILGGVSVFVIGEVIRDFVITPIQEQSRLRGEIADTLIFYANVYTNPGAANDELAAKASTDLRRQAAQLRARTCAIPLYGLWEFCRLVLKRSDVRKASENLIGLSNSVHSGDPEVNDGRRKQITSALKIDF